MKHISVCRKGLAAALSALIFVLVCLPLMAAADENENNGAPAEAFKKVETHYDIAVVFDNSLSMFFDPDAASVVPIERWSRAKFAMEIFASMLDLSGGDTLTVFPMWRVAAGETEEVPEAERAKKREESLPPYLAGANDVVPIHSPDDISNMYTVYAGDTPFDAVENAFAYLKTKGGENREKWLVILTDGSFDLLHNEAIPADFDVKAAIDALNDGSVKVQCLSIDPDQKKHTDAFEKIEIKDNEKDRFFVDTAEGNGIQSKLIEICNRIFKRNELKGAVNGKTLKLEISMRRVIVFVQGDGVSVNGLIGPDGETIKATVDSGPRRYSDISFGYSGYKKWVKDDVKTDNTLFGQVATFENLVGEDEEGKSTGEYTLDIKGSVPEDKIKIFYEPDVRIKTELFHKGTGEKITENEELHEGEYTLKCSIVDRRTGKDVSDSPLLGDTKYKITVANAGKTYEIGNNQDITLEKDESGNTSIDVEFTYLDDYTIWNNDSPWFSGNGGVSVEPGDPKPSAPEPQLVITEIKDKSDTYVIPKHESWKPLRVEVRLIKDADVSKAEEPLTDEQLEAIVNTVTLKSSKEKETPNVTLSKVKALKGESAFEIYLYTDKDGVFHTPEPDKETLTITCRLHVHSEKPAPANWHQTEPVTYEKDVEATEKTKLEFSNVEPIVKILIILGVSLLLLALLLWFMSRKVLPKKIVKQSIVYTIGGKQIQGQNVVNYNRKGKRLSVRSAMPPKPEQECKISFSLYPVGRRWTPSRRRKFGINGISGPSMGVKSVTLNGITYNRDKSNKFVAVGANPDDPIKDESIGAMIVVNASRASLNCVLVQK